MAKWLVTWKIDIEEAETPRDAAREALKIQRDPQSTATVFEVTDESGIETQIDLDLD